MTEQVLLKRRVESFLDSIGRRSKEKRKHYVGAASVAPT
jgi:hypothetical protein